MRWTPMPAINLFNRLAGLVGLDRTEELIPLSTPSDPDIRCQLCGNVTPWADVLPTLKMFLQHEKPAIFWECKSTACQTARRMPVLAYLEMKSEVAVGPRMWPL